MWVYYVDRAGRRHVLTERDLESLRKAKKRLSEVVSNDVAAWLRMSPDEKGRVDLAGAIDELSTYYDKARARGDHARARAIVAVINRIGTIRRKYEYKE